MVNRYVLIKNGVVFNVVEQTEVPPAEYSPVIDATAQVGWTYINGVFASPTPPPRPAMPNPAILVIDAQLAALDQKKIRPLAEGDTGYLATLNAQTLILRTQRAALPAIV